MGIFLATFLTYLFFTLALWFPFCLKLQFLIVNHRLLTSSKQSAIQENQERPFLIHSFNLSNNFSNNLANNLTNEFANCNRSSNVYSNPYEINTSNSFKPSVSQSNLSDDLTTNQFKSNKLTNLTLLDDNFVNEQNIHTKFSKSQ